MTQETIRPETMRDLMDVHRSQVEKITKDVVDVEMGLFELNLHTSSLGDDHLDKAKNDTGSFKKKMWHKANELAEKSGIETLEEYKKLINFI